MPTFSAGDVEALFTLRDEMTRKLRAVRKELRDSGKDFDAQGKKVVAYESGWKRAGTQIQAHATQIRAGGAALVALGASTGAAWDSATKTIAAGTGDTGAALDQLKADYKSVLLSVPADGGQVAAGLAEIRTQTGLSGESLRLLVTDAAKAGHALDVDIGQLSAGVGQAMKRLGLDVDEGRALIADLTKASQTYGVKLGELTGQLNTYGPVLENVGFSTRETAVFFGDLESRGVEVSRIMPGLNKSFRDWAKEGKNSREELQRVIDQMRSAGSEAEAMALAIDIFGSEGAPRLTAAIRSGAIPSLADLGASLGDTTRTIDETAEATRTMQDWIGRSKNILTGAIGPVGEYATALGGVGIALPTVSAGLGKLTPLIRGAIPPTLTLTTTVRGLWLALSGPVGLAIGIGVATAALVKLGLEMGRRQMVEAPQRLATQLDEVTAKISELQAAGKDTSGFQRLREELGHAAEAAARMHRRLFPLPPQIALATIEFQRLVPEVLDFGGAAGGSGATGAHELTDELKALIAAERELLITQPQVRISWDQALQAGQRLGPELFGLTRGTIEGAAAQRGLGAALIGTRLEAEHLSGDVGRLRDELLGLPTQQARDDFARLELMWKTSSTAQQAALTDAYAEALRDAAEAGIQLNDAQMTLASSAGASWLDRYREILSPDAIGQTLARAFEGASGFLGALKSLASQVATTFMSQFGGWLSAGLKRVLPAVLGGAAKSSTVLASTNLGTLAGTTTGGSMLSSLGTTISTGAKAVGSTLMSVASAIPVWGWAAAGGLAAFAFFKGFGGPSKAEKEARKTFGSFRERAIAEMGQTQVYIDEVQRAVKDGWDRTLAETRAAFILTGTTAGVAYDEAFQIYGRYEKAVRDGNTALMTQIEATYAQWQQTAKESGAQVAAAAAATNAELIAHLLELSAVERDQVRTRLQAALTAMDQKVAADRASLKQQMKIAETLTGKRGEEIRKQLAAELKRVNEEYNAAHKSAVDRLTLVREITAGIGESWDQTTTTVKESVASQRQVAVAEYHRLRREASGPLGDLTADLDRAFGDRDFTITQHLRSTGSHQRIEPRQHGGPVRSGRPYLVGEAGPEILIPRVSGTIAPVGRSRSAAGGSGSGSGIDYEALGRAVAAALRASPPVVTLDGRRVTASVLRHEPSMTAFEGLR